MEDSSDLEAAVKDAIAAQMEATGDLIGVLEALQSHPELRGTVSNGELEGVQSRLHKSNEQMKRLTRNVGVEFSEEELPSNWNDVLTLED